MIQPQPASARREVTSSGVPLRIFTRLPLPVELARAIGDALNDAGVSADARFREAVALRTRLALEAWLDGRSTTEQAVDALRAARTRAVSLGHR